MRRLKAPAADMPMQPSREPGKRYPAWLSAVMPLVFLVLALSAGFVLWRMDGHWLAGFQTTAAGLEALVRRWGAWGPLASILLMVLHAFLPFPAEAVAFANGMLFGLWLGTLLTWTGAMIGAGLSYVVARWLGAWTMAHLVPVRHRARLTGMSQHLGVGPLLLVRLIPVISFNLVNYAAGLADVRPLRFFWTTGLGILPLTFLNVLLGQRLASGPGYAWLLLVSGVVIGVVTLRLVRQALAGRRD